MPKVWVCGCTLAGIVVLNPAGGLDVCLLWMLCCQVKGLCVRLIICPEETYWALWFWVWWRLDSEEALAHYGLLHHEKKNNSHMQDWSVIGPRLCHDFSRLRSNTAQGGSTHTHTHTHTHLYVCTEIWQSVSKCCGFVQLTCRCHGTVQLVHSPLWQHTGVGQNGMPWSSAAFSG